MPISRKQFDKELDQIEDRTLEFLKQHPKKAYDLNEVGRGKSVTGGGRPESTAIKILLLIPFYFAIHDALNRLVEKGLVDKKTIGGSDQYSIHKD